MFCILNALANFRLIFFAKVKKFHNKMWILKNIATGNVLIMVNEKAKYAVGRVGADLVISDDSSISRTHAFLHLTITQKSNMDGEAHQTIELLELEDAGSKYGTFHNNGIENGVGLPKQKRIPLSEGDRICFGVLKSLWIVSKITPIITASGLSIETAKQLKQCIQVLGGSFLTVWKATYTHLTLSEVKMTPKLLHAVLDQKPIVTCDYWCSLVQAARRGRRTLPNASAYTPSNPENLDLKYREERKIVFKNITFVFLNARHFNTYAPIVEKAGGMSKHLNVGIQKSFLVRKDVVVIHYVPSTESQSSQTISAIEDCLKQHSRRTVPEYEIFLAIIHCSTKIYCNASYKISENLGFESETNESSVQQSSVQSSCNQNDLSNPLEGDQTEVFVPETERKSTASTHLTDKSTVEFTATRSDQNASVTIESRNLKQKDTSPSDVAMSSLQVTESAQEVNRRKRTRGIQKDVNTSAMDSDEDDLFNFAAKKAHLETKSISPVTRVTRQQRKSSNSPLDESATTSAAAIAKQIPKSSEKQLPITINRRSTKRTTINMTGFLEKSQAQHITGQKTDVECQNISNNNNTSKQGAKRARIAVLDNSDDDDLFCFGGKSNSKEESNIAKRARGNDNGCDSDEDLFNFGGAESDDLNRQEDAMNVDSNKQPQAEKNNSKSIVMPKPKPLPAKVCVSDWLDCSLSALSIKAEQMKDEMDANKRENNDSGVEGDSKENVDLFKGGCVVTTLSPKTLIQEREWSRNTDIPQNEDSNVISATKNFKKFVKKFQPKIHKVIRTVSSTVSA